MPVNRKSAKSAPTASEPRHPDIQPAAPRPDAPLSRFDIAVARAQGRYTAEQWALLEPSTRTASIYAELRHLDSLGGKARLAAE